jgi:hypothetical protein
MAAKKRFEKLLHKTTNFNMREQSQSPLKCLKIRNNAPPNRDARSFEMGARLCYDLQVFCGVSGMARRRYQRGIFKARKQHCGKIGWQSEKCMPAG